MTEPIVFEPVPQKDTDDCCIVCLVMLLGKSYPDVVKACPKRGRKYTGGGLTTRQMVNVATRLKTRVECVKTYEEDDIGILNLARVGEYGTEGHVVMYAKGVLYNPAQNEIWTDVESYLERGRWRIDEGLIRRLR